MTELKEKGKGGASVIRSVGGQGGSFADAGLCRYAIHQLVCDAAICVLEGLALSCSPVCGEK